MQSYVKLFKEKEVDFETKNIVLPKRKLHVFSLILLCFFSFGILGFSVNNLSVKNEVKTITSSWAPNINGLGKIKYVNSEQEEVFSHVMGMQMPFKNTFVRELNNGVFLVNGLGGVVVKACLEGKVIKVEGTTEKTVRVSHGKNLVSVYSCLNNVGVKVGDGVTKNTPLGVSLTSTISFQMLYKNKPIAGLTVKDGEMQFL